VRRFLEVVVLDDSMSVTLELGRRWHYDVLIDGTGREVVAQDRADHLDSMR
jgi:hypothetical protein